MRIPSNIIRYNYTIGGEFVYASNQKDYQGHYYFLGNQYYAGKEFNINAPALYKKLSPEYNTLLDNPNLKTYSLISGKTSQELSSPKYTPIAKLDLDTDQEEIETYYAKKVNINPPFIKQIDKKAYFDLQKDPFYQVVSLKSDYSNLDEAEKQMPGLKLFLGIS
jgi:hypothetical protein